MKLTQGIVGTTNCTLTTYSTESEEAEYRRNALNTGAKEDGILSNMSRQFKAACDKRIRLQGAYESSFFPV
jgi:hypothetical protein